MQPKLKVEYLPVSELAPYAGNAKKHPEWQVEQIANSIEQFGNCDPIAIWHNAEGVPEIVEGHGRLLALKMLGIDKAPTIALDHLDDDARRAYTHIHNQLTMNTGWDVDALNAEIGRLSDFDWGNFGIHPAADSEPAGENGFEYKSIFAVEVVCADEQEQERTFNDLTSMGYECKVVVV